MTAAERQNMSKTPLIVANPLLPSVLRGDACNIRADVPVYEDVAQNLEQAATRITELEFANAELR